MHPNANTRSNPGRSKYVPSPITNTPIKIIGNAITESRIPRILKIPQVAAKASFIKLPRNITAKMIKKISNILYPFCPQAFHFVLIRSR